MTDTNTATDVGQGAPATEPTPEGTAPEAAPQQVVQPTETGSEAQPDGGQGLIAPYLEAVDEAIRPQVAETLERFRQDQDAQVTKRFEQLNAYRAYAEDPSQLEVPVTLYENLMTDPAGTLKWVIERYREEAGVDLVEQLKDVWESQAQEPQPQETPATEEKPLTRAELDAYFQERQQAEAQAVEAQQRMQTVDGWLKEAGETHNIDIGGNPSVKESIVRAAASLMPKLQRRYGDDAGRQAILVATNAFLNTFGRTQPAPQTTQQPEPRVAVGGTPPAPEDKPLDTPQERKAFMRDFMAKLHNQE